MAGVKLGAFERLEIRAAGNHELDGAVDLLGQLFVTLIRRVRCEPLIPTVHLPEVCKSALRERPNEIQGRGSRVVALHQPCGVCFPRLWGEVVAIDDVATVCGERHVTARLVVARTRLGELAGHAPHLHDRHRSAIREHDCHLQHRLDPVSDLVCGGTIEGFGTVAALQQKGFAAGGLGQPVAQDVDLAGEDERRLRRKLGRCRGNRIGVRPGRLLPDRQGAPIVKTSDHRVICQHNWFGGVYHWAIPVFSIWRASIRGPLDGERMRREELNATVAAYRERLARFSFTLVA